MNKTLSKLYQPNIVKWALNSWPPFWGAGIHIESIGADFREVRIRLKLRWWNKTPTGLNTAAAFFTDGSRLCLDADGHIGAALLRMGQRSVH